MSKASIAKLAMLTDIHFGAKSNSDRHNEDCLEYLDWFCDQVKRHPSIDAIAFLGDWYENRNALNIQTMNYSYQGAKKLNDLDLPIYSLIGNHDLYRRHTRDIHSVIKFTEFTNFTLIEEPMILENKHGDVLLCPYMFHEEYEGLLEHTKIPVWLGHFEFRDFVLTGGNVKMTHGPNPKDFKGPKSIFSGHYHKRQQMDNIIYIGNTFPTNFGDANDFERGMAIYDFKTNKTKFIDWDDAPRYMKTKLTTILNGKFKFYPKAYVQCLVDVPISYEESTSLKHTFIEKHDLRDFILEESPEIVQALTETDVDDIEIDFDVADLASIDATIVKMLEHIETEHIENDMLIVIYNMLTKSLDGMTLDEVIEIVYREEVKG